MTKHTYTVCVRGFRTQVEMTNIADELRAGVLQEITSIIEERMDRIVSELFYGTADDNLMPIGVLSLDQEEVEDQTVEPRKPLDDGEPLYRWVVDFDEIRARVFRRSMVRRGELKPYKKHAKDRLKRWKRNV